MEFHQYWRIIWERRRLIVPLVVITFVASALLNLVLPPTYKTDTTVYVQPVIRFPLPGTPEYFPVEYYTTVYSEYLADDLGVIIKGKDFAEKVAFRIEDRYGDRVSTKDVIDAIAQTKKTHRTLKITIASGSERFTRRLGEALDEVLRSDGWKYFTRDDRQPIVIQVIDPPREVTSPSVIRRLLDVLLQTAVALVVGVGIAFLLNYLDDRVRDEADAARLTGWPVLGAVPSEDAGRASARGPAAMRLGWLPGLRSPRSGLTLKGSNPKGPVRRGVSAA